MAGIPQKNKKGEAMVRTPRSRRSRNKPKSSAANARQDLASEIASQLKYQIAGSPKPGPVDPDNPNYGKATLILTRPVADPNNPFRALFIDPRSGFGFTDTIALYSSFVQDWQLTSTVAMAAAEDEGKLALGNALVVSTHKNYKVHGARPNKAVLEVDLPFRLSRLDGSHLADNGLTVEFKPHQHPVNIGAYNASFPNIQGEIEHFIIEPDNWGLAGVTTAVIEVPLYLGEPNREYLVSILKIACRAINYLIDLYSLYTNNYSLRRVSAVDFARVELRHQLGDEHLMKFVWYFPEKVRVFFASPEGADRILAQQVTDFKSAYSVAYRLYVSARRASVTDDLRTAAIEASQAVEVAAFIFIEAVLRANTTKICLIPRKTKRPRQIDHATFNKPDPRIAFDDALNHLLLQVIPQGSNFDPTILGDCDALRLCRNIAVHKPHHFKDSMLDVKLLEAARSLIDFLAVHHP
jgi:hypothetical protein